MKIGVTGGPQLPLRSLPLHRALHLLKLPMMTQTNFHSLTSRVPKQKTVPRLSNGRNITQNESRLAMNYGMMKSLFYG